MSESFDPYHMWLGIPPESRPPTHYELLGISPNEREKAVIEAAVLRQSGYVRNFQIGKYGKDAARILNEIGAAKGCLIDPAKRAKYDAELKARQPVPVQTPSPAAQVPAGLAPLPPTVELDLLAAAAAPAAPRPVPRRRPVSLAPRKRKAPNIPWQLPAGIGVSICIVLIAVVLWPKPAEEQLKPPAKIVGTVVLAAGVERDLAKSEPPVSKPQLPVESVRSVPPPPTVSGPSEAIVGGLPARGNETPNSLDTLPTAAANKLLATAVALYRAEGDANDSARNHHGKLQGDAAIAPIEGGHAFKFAGDGAVVVPDAPDLNPTERFTLMAWIRPDARWWSTVLDKSTVDGGAKRQGFRLAIGDYLWVFGQFNAPGEPFAKNEAACQIRSYGYKGQWLHIASTYDGHVLKLYRDGVVLLSRDIGRKSVCRTEANLTIGGRWEPGFIRFRGLIDDAALFDRALTTTEIETVFRGTRTGKEWLTREQEAVLEQHTNGSTIDVLALVDPARDSKSGKWAVDVDGLHSPANSLHATLCLPVATPNEYSLSIVAERADGWRGDNPTLNVGVIANGKQFNSLITIRAVGLERIDGTRLEKESTVHSGRFFEDGRTSVLTYLVGQTSVEILFDGKQVFDWHDSFARFGLHDGWRSSVNSPLRLYLGTHCDWHFKAILLTPLTGANAASAPDKTTATDLLKTIDLKKHTRGGWAFDGPVLVSPPNVIHAGVRFPGVVPDEYHLRIVAERPRGFQGPSPFHVGLVTRTSQATLVLDADHKSGLAAIDGKMYDENATTFPGDLFIDGIDSTIDCYVDKESIRVDIDGHTIINWRGDLKRLTPTWTEFGAPKRAFWIGTHCNWRIKKVELMPLKKE